MVVVVVTTKIVEDTVVPHSPHKGEDPHRILETQLPQTAPGGQLVVTGLLLTTHKAVNMAEGVRIPWVATETSNMAGSNSKNK